MKREELDRKEKLEETITLFGRQCQLTEASAAQQTLKRITNSIHEQNRIHPRIAGRRNRPDSSDTSSMADSYNAEEEGSQSTSMISNKNKAVSDIPNKPGSASSDSDTS